MDQTTDAVPQQPSKTVRIRVTARPLQPWKKTYSVPEMYFAEEVPSPYPGQPPVLKPRTNVTSRELDLGVPTVMEVETRLAADLRVDPNLHVEDLGPDEEDEDERAPSKQLGMQLTEDERELIIRRRQEHDTAAGSRPKAKKKAPAKRTLRPPDLE